MTAGGRQALPVGAVVLLALALSHPQEAAPTPIDDAESYAVYASLLQDEWIVRAAHAKQVVFQRETDAYLRCMPKGPSLATDWKETVDAYRAANDGARWLREGFALGIPYVVVSKADIEASFQDKPTPSSLGWEGFYKRYPDSGGFMVVSAVGFNADKTRALVYMSHDCGALCGGGTHHLLQKLDGRWRDVRPRDVAFCAWAS